MEENGFRTFMDALSYAGMHDNEEMEQFVIAKSCEYISGLLSPVIRGVAAEDRAFLTACLEKTCLYLRSTMNESGNDLADALGENMQFIAVSVEEDPDI